MIPGRRNDHTDPWLLPVVHETPTWLPERPLIVSTTTTCPDCHGAGEHETCRRIPADMFGPAEPVMARCGHCQGTGQVSLELAGVCEGCGESYWLEEGCPHAAGGHWCHDCAPSRCDECMTAWWDDSSYTGWGGRYS